MHRAETSLRTAGKNGEGEAMRESVRTLRPLGILAAAAALVLVPTAAQAKPGFYAGPIFGISTGPDDQLLVANAGKGIVDGDTGVVLAPASEFSDSGLNDVEPIAGTDDLWAITGGAPGIEDRQFLYRVDENGNASVIADLWGFEEKFDPYPADVNSNPFDVEDLGGGEALVVDAGGNSLLTVNKHGKVKLVAVLPEELSAQPVPTSVVVGPDGAYYVGELTGVPAPIGASRIWRIAPNARNARCGRSPLCTVAFDGFTSIIDLAIGPDGRLYVAQLDDASWLALGTPAQAGGSVHACNLTTNACETVIDRVPILTSITFRPSGLWGSILALAPGMADVVKLT